MSTRAPADEFLIDRGLNRGPVAAFIAAVAIAAAVAAVVLLRRVRAGSDTGEENPDEAGQRSMEVE